MFNIMIAYARRNAESVLANGSLLQVCGLNLKNHRRRKKDQLGTNTILSLHQNV